MVTVSSGLPAMPLSGFLTHCWHLAVTQVKVCGSWVRVGGHTRSAGWWQCDQVCPACHCQAPRLQANASTAGPSTHTPSPWCSFHKTPYRSTHRCLQCSQGLNGMMGNTGRPTRQFIGACNSELGLEFWWVDGHRLQDLAAVVILLRFHGSASAASDTQKDTCVILCSLAYVW